LLPPPAASPRFPYTTLFRSDQPLEAHRGVLRQHGASDVQPERLLHVGRHAVADEPLELDGDAPAHLVDVGIDETLLTPRRGEQAAPESTPLNSTHSPTSSAS